MKSYIVLAASGLQAPSALGGPSSVGEIITIVTNLLLGIAGTAAVIAIIVGGIQYATSGGDQEGLKRAKNTITYAVVGLIVAILAFAIVNFVLDLFN